MLNKYVSDNMKDIWKNPIKYWGRVEAAVLRFRNLPYLASLIEIETEQPEFIQNVKQTEKITKHEVTAFLSVLENRFSRQKGIKKLHNGLTSSDIVDTARMLQIKDSIELILQKLNDVITVLREQANDKKSMLVLGRTHGQSAEPTTFGLKLLKFLDEAMRCKDRMFYSMNRILKGKISGAVGTYSLNSPTEEKRVLEELELGVCNVSSQIIPRDLFIEYVVNLTFICSMAENIATEIRLLAQSGIDEVTEGFTSGQTGSSTMPHKKNPISSEQICGLSRLVKGYLTTMFMNTGLWNERDLTHSSNERVLLEDASCVTLYVLEKLEKVLRNLRVSKVNALRNLRNAGKSVYSSYLLKMLIDKGNSRQEAYKKIQDAIHTDDAFLNEFDLTKQKILCLDEIFERFLL